MAGLSRVTIRASLDVSLRRMKSLGGFVVALGSGLMVEGVGSGVGSLGAGLERVALAMVMMIAVYIMLEYHCSLKYNYPDSTESRVWRTQMHVSRFLRKWYASATRPTRHANPCRFSPDWLEPQPYSHSQRQQQTASQHSHTKTENRADNRAGAAPSVHLSFCDSTGTVWRKT